MLFSAVPRRYDKNKRFVKELGKSAARPPIVLDKTTALVLGHCFSPKVLLISEIKITEIFQETMKSR